MVVPSYQCVSKLAVGARGPFTYNSKNDGEIIPPEGMDYPDTCENAEKESEDDENEECNCQA